MHNKPKEHSESSFIRGSSLAKINCWERQGVQFPSKHVGHQKSLGSFFQVPLAVRAKTWKNDELEIQQHGFYPSVPIWTPAALQCSSSSSDDDDDDDDVFDDSFNRVGILTRERKKRDLLFVHHHQRRMTSNVDFCWRKKPRWRLPCYWVIFKPLNL